MCVSMLRLTYHLEPAFTSILLKSSPSHVAAGLRLHFVSRGFMRRVRPTYNRAGALSIAVVTGACYR